MNKSENPNDVTLNDECDDGVVLDGAIASSPVQDGVLKADEFGLPFLTFKDEDETSN